MLFRYLVIRALIGPTLRPARACLTRGAFTSLTSHTSSPRRLNPLQSIAFSTKSEPSSHSLPTTVQNTAQTDQKNTPLDPPDHTSDAIFEILQSRNFLPWEGYRGLNPVNYSAEAAIAIRDSLREFNLSKWGFVIFRCTYRSQEKWDKFVALAKAYARAYFEQCEMQTIYDRMEWTIIEDAAALDGADIVETSRRFREWIDWGPGRQEMVGTKLSPTLDRYVRYTTFLHIDEESLESVVDDAKAREEGGYSCKIVNGGAVLLEDNALLAAKDREEVRAVEEVDEAELWEFRKRVKINGLVSVYANLDVDLDGWYYLIMDGDVIVG
ncbi:hypothetical protein C8A00DRAFT_18416 [Chaetomidium leptoderma]|uniref:Uncharacterized protein n=1 Tax=Chaetomidium leptoderma TaxID=669021 RepID=A0AAN6VF73_9PEZI|nr:hypothetical protein C8A00DRAFT_18416 [Chaetomidium leptoderma]